MRLEEAGDEFRAAYAAYERAGELGQAASHRRYVGFNYLHQGLLDQSVEANEHALSFAREVHHRLTEQIALGYLGVAALLRGNHDRVVELGRALPGDWFWMSLLQMARYELEGDLDAALEVSPEPSAVAMSPSIPHAARARVHFLRRT